ncbi:MAG: SGNH/GDSL hydrolase family protein [Oligosphaeraceae bacterium]|nr:SGNH/GDSL hydrolase family protein [Oligosphaeraceae bacterium]
MSGKIVLFQGDSITDAGRSREISMERSNLDLGQGYPTLVTASLLKKMPGQGLRFFNRGVSGDRVVNLYARWKIDALNLKPDLISILVGVNDTGHGIPPNNNGVEPERYGMVYRQLLEWTKQQLPEVTLVLMEPFVLLVDPVNESWLPEMNERSRIVKELSAEFDAVFVPCQSILNQACQVAPASYWLLDGVHPSLAGHQLLADAWIKATEKFFA